MTQQIIGIGSEADDGTGDPARTAGQKINDNFTELYELINSHLGGGEPGEGIGESPEVTNLTLSDGGEVRFAAAGGGIPVWIKRIPDADHEEGLAVCGTDQRGGKIAIYANGIGTDNYQRLHIKKSSLSGSPWVIVSRARGTASPTAVPIEIRITTATTDTGSGDVNHRAIRIETTGVGIYDVEPDARLSVGGGDISVKDIGSGLILKSPNGDRWRLTVGNDGALETNAL